MSPEPKKRRSGGKFRPDEVGNPERKNQYSKAKKAARPQPEVSATADQKQNDVWKGGPWPEGYSGNPAGRKPGTRNYATRLAEALIDASGETLTALCIQKAREGDMVAMRLVMERLIAPRRERPVSVELPSIAEPKDLIAASSAILKAVAAEEVTPSEAASLSTLADSDESAML
jgi:Family of unknown function (DUF5681)